MKKWQVTMFWECLHSVESQIPFIFFFFFLLALAYQIILQNKFSSCECLKMKSVQISVHIMMKQYMQHSCLATDLFIVSTAHFEKHRCVRWTLALMHVFFMIHLQEKILSMPKLQWWLQFTLVPLFSPMKYYLKYLFYMNNTVIQSDTCYVISV